MINVTIIAVGGLKEKYLRDACGEYEKRLSAFCGLKIVELDEFRLGQNPSEAEIKKALKSEAAAIVRQIPKGAVAVPLCIEGGEISSEAFARYIEKAGLETSSIAFIIGGSHGLDAEIKALGKLRLSMSPMTFPHQLARVMLLEQIYRAFTITGGMKYHK